MAHFWLPYSVIFWAAVILIVLIVSFFNYRARVSRHRLIEKMVEKGQQITPELIDRIKGTE